jgi:hypothetical protein
MPLTYPARDDIIMAIQGVSQFCGIQANKQ